MTATGAGVGRRRAGEEQERIYRRRRFVALAVGIVSLIVLVRGCSTVVGGGDEASSSDAAVPQLPRGGREILPRNRVVAYYGAPQDRALGVLATAPLDVVASRLDARAKEYERPGRPVLPAFELIVTLAQSSPGDDGSHRLHQTDAV